MTSQLHDESTFSYEIRTAKNQLSLPAHFIILRAFNTKMGLLMNIKLRNGK